MRVNFLAYCSEKIRAFDSHSHCVINIFDLLSTIKKCVLRNDLTIIFVLVCLNMSHNGINKYYLNRRVINHFNLYRVNMKESTRVILT